MKTSFIELENKELHLRSGLSIMLQILNLSMRSKKIGIPLPAFRNFYHPPYSLQNFKPLPPTQKKILCRPPTPPCGIHNECSLSLPVHSPSKHNVPVNQILSINICSKGYTLPSLLSRLSLVMSSSSFIVFFLSFSLGDKKTLHKVVETEAEA